MARLARAAPSDGRGAPPMIESFAAGTFAAARCEATTLGSVAAPYFAREQRSTAAINGRDMPHSEHRR